jgi:hypothetical protein
VGVGTATANSKLTVAGLIETTTGGVKFPDGTTQITAGAGTTMSAANVSSGDFGSNTGGGNYSFPSSLGIGGATSPAEKVEIAGGHTTTRIRMSAATAQAAPNDTAYLSLWASEPGLTYTGAGIGNNILGNSHYGRISTARGASYIRLLDDSIRFNTISTAGADTNSMIMAAGNVGIGTTPSERLDVSGSVKINEYRIKRISATSMGVYDSTNTVMLEFDEGV